MKVTFLDQAGIASTLKKLMGDFEEFYWAVAWGTENEHSDQLVANKKKIKQLIFGTHFYQSDPRLLERFKDEAFARAMPNDTAGTFHPKVYLFINGYKAAAIVGSANFTNGAMSKNNEAALLIECDSSAPSIIGIKHTIAEAWKNSEIIDDDFLADYRLHYQATARHRNALERPRKRVKPAKDAKNTELRTWSWDEYARQVRRDRYGNYDGRLNLLKEARELFAQVNSFSELEDDELRAIGGWLEKGNTVLDGGVNEWGWFGSMKGHGDYKNLILTRSQYISDAVDAIPFSGDVSKDQYDEYIRLFQKAFERATHKAGVPTASRLLAMKRPDMFVCVNDKNRTWLGKDLGFAPTTLTFNKYWDEVIIPITESNWWQAARPSGRDGLLWDGRSAMLDSIYYEGHD